MDVLNVLINSDKDFKIEIKTINENQKRSEKFSRGLHAVFSDISKQMTESGLDKNLTLEIEPTPENIKFYFNNEFLKPQGAESTSKANNVQLSKATDLFLNSFNLAFAKYSLPEISIKGLDFLNLLKWNQNNDLKQGTTTKEKINSSES